MLTGKVHTCANREGTHTCANREGTHTCANREGIHTCANRKLGIHIVTCVLTGKVHRHVLTKKVYIRTCTCTCAKRESEDTHVY